MKRSLDLMTDDAARRGELREAIRFWSRALLVLALVLLPWAAQSWRCGALVRAERDLLEMRYDSVRAIRRDIASIKTQRKQLLSEHAYLLALSQQRPVTTLLGRVAQAAEATDGRLSVKRLVVDPLRGSGDEQEPTSGRLVIETVCDEEYDVENFANLLRGAPFEQVEVKDLSVSEENGRLTRTGSVECRF